MRINRIRPDISVLADALEIPGLGHLPVNAFVLHATEPVVIDTGLGLADRDFLSDLATILDPTDVAWIWLTHPDRDHTGALHFLLDAAPHARLITTFGAVGTLSCERPVPLDRVYFLNPGESIDVGDRRLVAFRPPLFDNPCTVGCYDPRSSTCFTSDCLGAPLSSAHLATADDATAITESELVAAQQLWASVDSPWVRLVDPGKYLPAVHSLRSFGADQLLSTHLPPVMRHTDIAFDMLAGAPDVAEFSAPDQGALEALLASFESAPSTVGTVDG
ncbi:MBL fold metallo-hydrolase [Gordonia sp. NPDC003376]